MVMIKMLYFEYKDHFRNIICRLLEQMEGGSVGGITTVNMINGTYNEFLVVGSMTFHVGR